MSVGAMEPPEPPMSVRPTGPAPWSAAAIAGFVCSLLGCLGVTAVAGLILGIIGLVKTSGGRRRGFGFAVAAIPLSLLSGIAFGFLILTIIVGRQLVAMPDRVESVLERIANEPSEAVIAFRGLTSADFDASISDDRLQQWFAAVTAKHGKLTKILLANPTQLLSARGANGEVTQSLKGKFVNDTVDIQLTFARHSGYGDLTIDDIDVGGSSPRDPSEKTTTP